MGKKKRFYFPNHSSLYIIYDFILYKIILFFISNKKIYFFFYKNLIELLLICERELYSKIIFIIYFYSHLNLTICVKHRAAATVHIYERNTTDSFERKQSRESMSRYSSSVDIITKKHNIDNFYVYAKK